MATATGPALTVTQLEAAGGRRWQKNGKDRIYFNGLDRWLGLATSRYNSGNISGATLDGQPISNSAARRLAMDCAGSTLYYDVPTGAFMVGGPLRAQHGDVATIIARIRAAAAEQVAVPSARYVCEECGQQLTQPFCPQCRDEMMIRELA